MQRIILLGAFVVMLLALLAPHASADCTIGGNTRSHVFYAIVLHDGSVSGYVIGRRPAHAYADQCGGRIMRGAYAITECDE